MKDIKNLCTETSFERGVDYFQMGNVTDLEQFENKITATVEGTRDYTVTIRIDKKIKGFVNLLKTKYAKRPAFLDEMKYI
jgi:uncharacterized Zn finger protein